MLRRFFAHLHREGGAAIVETAMVLMVVPFILAGIVDFGRAFNRYIVLGEASRQGARYGSMNPSDEGGIQQAAVSMAANNGFTIGTGDVVITGLGSATGQSIRVTVNTQYNALLGSILGFNAIPMSAATELVIAGGSPYP